jgi:hypothetical protein
MSFESCQRWLLAVVASLVPFGLLLALAYESALFAAINARIDAAFWGSEPVPAAASRYAAWVHAVLGGAMAGWGVSLTFVVHHAFRRREPWARSCVLWGLATWFVIDTVASLRFGVHANALLNLALLVAAAPPLILVRRHLAP